MMKRAPAEEPGLPLSCAPPGKKSLPRFFLAHRNRPKAVEISRKFIPRYFADPRFSAVNKCWRWIHDEITRRIREAKADCCSFFGAEPKQEKWIAAYRSLGVPVTAGVGGHHDFLAGTVKAARLDAATSARKDL